MSTRVHVFGVLLAILTCAAGVPSSALAQQLLMDEFDGTGFIDQRIWRLPFGGDGSFLGRTQLKTDLSIDYPVQSVSAVDSASVASLRLDTFHDNGSGGSSGVFSGHEILTKRNFVVAGGLRFETRMRLDNPPPGIVGASFLYDVARTNGGGNLVRDEIDHELLGNEAQSGAQNRLLTNFWNDGPFVGSGADGNPDLSDPGIAGWDMTQFHDYRVDWLPNRIDWYVDDQLVRSAPSDTPDDPMSFRINLWAPDPGFGAAYSASLQPTNQAVNQTYNLEVDRVTITQLNTTRSPNLLVDGTFEDTGSGSLPTVGDADVGGWFGFANAFFDNQVSQSGTYAGKTFGPFNGGTDASGFLQNVAASPGEVFEASIFAQTIFADTIADTSNFGTIALEFLDSNGNVIGENRRESNIIQGLDPDTPVAEWVAGNVVAIAPAGTAKARVVLPFIQFAEGVLLPPDQDPGALWWDNASLVRLTETGGGGPGDFNGDGNFNCTDIDALVAEIVDGTNDTTYDLTSDSLVNEADLAEWLVLGGAANPAATGGNPFLPGDADLSGIVDGNDFLVWNGSKFSPVAAWCSGDFDASGVVDGQDFLIWNSNKFMSSDATIAAVPEPTSIALWCALFALCLGGRLRR